MAVARWAAATTLNEGADAPSLASGIRGGLIPVGLIRAEAGPDVGDPAAVGGNPAVWSLEAVNPDAAVRFGENPFVAASPADANPGGAMAADANLAAWIRTGESRVVANPSGGVVGGANRFGAKNFPDGIYRSGMRAAVWNPVVVLKAVRKAKAGRRTFGKRSAGPSHRQGGSPPAF